MSLALLGVLGGAPLYAAATTLPPFWLQHLRPLVQHLDRRLESSDVVYVYYGAGQAFYYYAARYGLPMRSGPRGPLLGGQPRGYLRQLDEFRGRDRVWIVITHARLNGTEAELIGSYSIRSDAAARPS